MSDHVSASSAGPEPVVGPLVVSDELFTLTSGSKGVTSTVESLQAELAAPLAGASLPAEAQAPASASADTTAAPASDAADTPPPGDAEPEPEKKPARRDRLGRMQAEIHAMTREKYDLRRELETLRQQREALKSERTAAPVSPATPESTAQQAEAARPVHPADAPDLGTRPTWEAYENAGKNFDEFQRDYEAYLERKVELRLSREAEDRLRMAREQAQHDAEATREAEYQAKLDAIERADPTFLTRAEAVLKAVPLAPDHDWRADLIRHHEAGPQVLKHWVDHPEELRAISALQEQGTLTTAMMIAALSMADPIPLVRHLATNPSEAAEIGRLPRDAGLLALGTISARLHAAAKHQATAAPAAPVTRAPTPVRPVGGARTTGDAVDIYDPSFPIEDFVRIRNARPKRG